MIKSYFGFNQVYCFWEAFYIFSFSVLFQTNILQAIVIFEQQHNVSLVLDHSKKISANFIMLPYVSKYFWEDFLNIPSTGLYVKFFSIFYQLLKIKITVILIKEYEIKTYSTNGWEYLWFFTLTGYNQGHCGQINVVFFIGLPKALLYIWYSI